jgi:hypothetical protein
MGDTERSRVLRQARGRALERLRREYDDRYQELLDQELVKAGHPARETRPDWMPRSRGGRS